MTTINKTIPLTPLRPGSPHTAAVRRLQDGANDRAVSRHLRPIAEDGDFGPETAHLVSAVLHRLGAEQSVFEAETISVKAQRMILFPEGRTEDEKRRARNRMKAIEDGRRKLAADRPLRLRALDHAQKLVGVMEEGGNNRGRGVARIILGAGGKIGEAWCGYFVKYCYQLAGLKSAPWQWAAVRLMKGASTVGTTRPLPGDIVRFTFDHTGFFVRDNGDGTITTLEGNTGASGAVSDSKTGGDGVYIKRRAKSLVRDYLTVVQ